MVIEISTMEVISKNQWELFADKHDFSVWLYGILLYFALIAMPAPHWPAASTTLTFLCQFRIK